MTKKVNRRLFLRGVGGAAVAAPLLGSLGWRSARAQAADPKRLIVFFTHYGCLTNRWFPTVSHGPLVAADYEATTLKHLAPFADKLLMPRGIRAMNEWSFEQSNGQETDPHTQVMASYFTCCPVDGQSGLNFGDTGIRSGVPERKFDARPVGGRSLDHVCAEQLSPNGTPLMMAIGGAQGGEMNNFSYRTAGVMDGERSELFQGIGSPATIYSEITNLFDMGAPMDEATYRVARGQNVLDVVREDLTRLQNANLSQSDKAKLEAWEQLLTETTVMVREQCGVGLLDSLGTTEDAIQAGATNNLELATPAMMNLAVLSAACDRVIFMKMPATYTFQFLPGIQGDTHGISHRIGDANMGGPCVSGVNEMIATIDDWYAQQFAYLVGQLDGIQETDGTLLDNTATVWFMEDSDGNSHNVNNVPILQAGGCGGYFKTGVAVNVDDGSASLSAGNSESACGQGDSDVSNADLDGTGTPDTLANAPINKYFCNLMNAIGVKGGADGFPAVGGSGPVTHFGYYDNTKDFASFLKASPVDPTIHDPGEFDDLRA
jgi:hypothetical protein